MTDKERITELTAQVAKNLERLEATREQLTATIAESKRILRMVYSDFPEGMLERKFILHPRDAKSNNPMIEELKLKVAENIEKTEPFFRQFYGSGQYQVWYVIKQAQTNGEYYTGSEILENIPVATIGYDKDKYWTRGIFTTHLTRFKTYESAKTRLIQGLEIERWGGIFEIKEIFQDKPK